MIGCGLCEPCRAGLPEPVPGQQGHRVRDGGRSSRGTGRSGRSFRSPTSSSCPSPKTSATRPRCSSPTSFRRAMSARSGPHIAPGSTVVVVGLGPVGVMAVQCAALFGPGPHLGHRHGARAAGPGRAARCRTDRRPDGTRTRAGHGSHQGARRRVGDRGRRRRRHRRRGRQLRRHRRHHLDRRGEPHHGPAVPDGPRLPQEHDLAHDLRPDPEHVAGSRPLGPSRAASPWPRPSPTTSASARRPRPTSSSTPGPTES